MNVSQLLVCNNHIFCSISPDLAGCPQLSLWETGQVLRWLSNTFCVQTSMSATRLPAPTAAVRTRWEATAACAATVSGCRTTPAQVRRRMCVCVCAVRVQHTYFFRMCEVWLFFFRCGRVRRRVSVSRPDVREHCGVVSLRFMSSRIHTRQQAVHRCVYQYKEFKSHTHTRSPWTHSAHPTTVHVACRRERVWGRRALSWTAVCQHGGLLQLRELPAGLPHRQWKVCRWRAHMHQIYNSIQNIAFFSLICFPFVFLIFLLFHYCSFLSFLTLYIYLYRVRLYLILYFRYIEKKKIKQRNQNKDFYISKIYGSALVLS